MSELTSERGNTVCPQHDEYLPERLEALAELVRIGRARAGFDPELLADSEDVLRRSGERLRLSAGHTVVAIAGGTGSGKSTLFNALAGATLSVPGVTRPTTREVHACVWGTESAAPLLDWLGVERRRRYSRASALDPGESELRGLVLLDLPDHDSVLESSADTVDRISKLADMVIWVLDPQKYADAAVHNRYLIPLARHAGLFTVVLNQIDVLTPSQAEDCAEDLRRLLESEGLDEAWLHSVSARAGTGLDDLRALLANAVSRSNAASERVAADLDSLLSRYTPYAPAPTPSTPAPSTPAPSTPAPYAPAPSTPASGAPTPTPTPPSSDSEVTFAGAIAPAKVTLHAQRGRVDGASAVAVPTVKPPWEMTPEELSELRAARNRPPWEDAEAEGPRRREPDPEELARNVPTAAADTLTSTFADACGLSAVADARASVRESQAARLTGWPLARAMGRGSVVPAASLGKQAPLGRYAPQSEVDTAITSFADDVGGRLPDPWPSSIRLAARSRADEVPPALAEAIRLPDPGRAAVPLSWRLSAGCQWLLLALAAMSVIAAVMIGVAHRPHGLAPLGGLPLVYWLAGLAVAMTLFSWLISFGCRNMASSAAEHERQYAKRAMRGRVTTVARNLVVAPVGQEIAEYERFRQELSVARGQNG